jgi:hypothetical protein
VSKAKSQKLRLTLRPYVGPRPFEERDKNWLFGREQEVNELFSLVLTDSVVLLYSPSGAGKSSLLNAGLLPRLRKEDCVPLPPTRVSGPPLAEGMQCKNIFVFEALSQWLEAKSGRRDDAFSQLAKDIIPDQLPQMSLAAFLLKLRRLAPEETPGESSYLPLVVVFDQFEELFTSADEYWEQRKNFFEQVAEALNAIGELRVVFSMREEYLAKLEPFEDLLPTKMHIRLRLERLRQEAARSAMSQPIARLGLQFDPQVLGKLITELLKIKTRDGKSQVTGEFVEAVQLQVVCLSIWDNLPNEFIEYVPQFLRNVAREKKSLRDAAVLSERQREND